MDIINSLSQLLNASSLRDAKNTPSMRPRDAGCMAEAPEMAFTLRQLESLLRDSGYSKASSRAISSNVWRAYRNRKDVSNGT